jgi:hypothetical protein
VATEIGWPSGRLEAMTAGCGARRNSRTCGGSGVLDTVFLPGQRDPGLLDDVRF